MSLALNFTVNVTQILLYIIIVLICIHFVFLRSLRKRIEHLEVAMQRMIDIAKMSASTNLKLARKVNRLEAVYFACKKIYFDIVRSSI